jgi:hypothetical protein
MLPWGTDQTWGDHLGFDEPAGGLLFDECYADASCKALYDEALEDLQALVGTLELSSKGQRYAKLLMPCQALELESRRRSDAAEIAAGVRATLAFVDYRSIPLDLYLGTSSPPNSPETANPQTEQPCPPIPSEEPKSESGAESGSATGKLRIGPSRLVGLFVTTRLNVPAAGRATQKVTARIDGSRRTVCTGRARSDDAGPLTVRCRLSEAAQDQLESGPLKLKVRVGFVSRGSGAKFDTRRLTLAKRP